MSDQTDNQTWIIDVGHDVIVKEDAQGKASLTTLERLIYCLWVADYGMNNGGDLETARDLHKSFQKEGAAAAKKLSLPLTHAAFCLPKAKLEARYFDLFEDMCREIRSVPFDA